VGHCWIMIYLYMVYERIYVLKMQATMKNVSWYNNYLHNFKDSDAKSSTLKATFVDEASIYLSVIIVKVPCRVHVCCKSS
jgi:hypothetical protein